MDYYYGADKPISAIESDVDAEAEANRKRIFSQSQFWLGTYLENKGVLFEKKCRHALEIGFETEPPYVKFIPALDFH